MRNLIIGKGEVGNSLFTVFSEHHETYIRDIEDFVMKDVDVLHICFPPFNGFDEAVIKYQAEYRPKITIIHSTVPVGTSRRLGAIHSPIHGKHPNLAEGIKTFVKYVGGASREGMNLAASFLLSAGIPVKIVSNPETSELSKICCTTQYGIDVVKVKEIEKMCLKYDANFDECYGWNAHYNSGYMKLGMPQFIRPVLKSMPGQIGGHCVVNNCHLMPDEPLMKFVLERNADYV